MSNSNKINFNGQIGSPEDLGIPFNNRSFKFGDGVFESIRVMDGQVPFTKLHLKRLELACKVLDLNLPTINWDHQIAKLLLINNVQSGGRIRLSVFRSGNGNYLPETKEIDFIIEVEQLQESRFRLNQNGIELGVYTEMLKPINKLSPIKSSNALLYIMAAKWASSNGFDDAVLLNQKGNICEGTSSNIFLVKNETLYTPSISQGCVAGTMRSVILKQANKLGIETKEVGIKREFLGVADECFLTNAIQGIKWVGAFNEKRYFNKLTFELHKSIVEEVQKEKV
jgi:branched-chain amino acid aminotransferase